MISRNYHCLVAGLPDLMIGDKKLPLSGAEFKDYLEEELHASDFELVKLLYYPFDHNNILDAIYKTNKEEFDKRGVFDQKEIELLIDKKELELGGSTSFPTYILDSVREIILGEDDVDRASADKMLMSKYFELLGINSNLFLKGYGDFEKVNRNLFVALNGRKFEVDFEDELIGEGDMIDALIKNRSRDFGLAAEIDNLDSLIQTFEQNDILERETKLDTIKWSYIDEITFFEYFTINRILAFVVKLLIVERWFMLDEERGKKLFRQLLKDLESSYEFPEEFKLSHGKKK